MTVGVTGVSLGHRGAFGKGAEVAYRRRMKQTHTWRVDVYDHEKDELVIARRVSGLSSAKEAADWVAEYLDLEGFTLEARIEVNLHDE